MSAENDIRDLMNQYCYAIDSGDFKTLQRLLQHAQWIAEGQTPGPKRLTMSFFTPTARHVPSTSSLTSASTDSGDATASAHSYVTVYQATDDFPLQAIFVGEYFDTFEKEGEGGGLPCVKSNAR